MKRAFTTTAELTLLSIAVALVSAGCGAGAPTRRDAVESAGGTAATAGISSGGSGATGGTSLIGVDSGTGTGGTGGDDCGGYALVAEPKTEPGNIVVLFDQSWTMAEPWSDPASGVSGPKHFVAGDALMQAMEPLKASVRAGAVFFPTTPAPTVFDLCPADVAPMSSAPQIPIVDGPQFMSQWVAHFQPPWATVLGTPLNKGLHQVDAALQVPPPGKTVVVLFTDGHWTCMDGTEAPTIAALRSRGIDTYVVGLPGAYGVVQLDDLAKAGGTAKPGCTANCYLLPTNPAELQAELGKIVTTTLQIDDCKFTFDPPPPDPGDVHLIVRDAGNPTPYELDQGGGATWSIAPDGSSATLEGATCDRAKAGDFESLQFVFGCPESFLQ